MHVVVANKDKSFLDFIPIQEPEINQKVRKMVFVPGKNGDITVDLKMTTTGNVAGSYRRYSHEYTDAKWRQWMEGLVSSSYPQATVTEQNHTINELRRQRERSMSQNQLSQLRAGGGGGGSKKSRHRK